ncbi:hypothetical protein PR202_ga22305 [Eleusine coracana subsp. coracana]|uniref:Uncharacterized protein n=1 Tax=Eleusine coracana subsp. coracana TaxID=191504 RepID=A0AAV5D3X4_ELECO|nr:hypothetical protein PR202_ga22305 [Eleusine coracana subsp. coracana]
MEAEIEAQEQTAAEESPNRHASIRPCRALEPRPTRHGGRPSSWPSKEGEGVAQVEDVDLMREREPGGRCHRG